MVKGGLASWLDSGLVRKPEILRSQPPPLDSSKLLWTFPSPDLTISWPGTPWYCLQAPGPHGHSGPWASVQALMKPILACKTPHFPGLAEAFTTGGPVCWSWVLTCVHRPMHAHLKLDPDARTEPPVDTPAAWHRHACTRFHRIASFYFLQESSPSGSLGVSSRPSVLPLSLPGSPTSPTEEGGSQHCLRRAGVIQELGDEFGDLGG